MLASEKIWTILTYAHHYILFQNLIYSNFSSIIITFFEKIIDNEKTFKKLNIKIKLSV